MKSSIRALLVLLVVVAIGGCSTDNGVLTPEGPDAPEARDGDGSDAGAFAGDRGAVQDPDAGAAGHPDAAIGDPDAATLEPDAGAASAWTCAGDSLAHQTFNAFWSAFDVRYALFDIRLAPKDWTQIGIEACTHVTAGMSDTELYDLLIGMADNLDDGHVTLTSASLGRDDDAWVSVYPFIDEVDAIEDNADTNYVDGDLVFGGDESIGWGRIGTLGYLSITAMDELTASGTEAADTMEAASVMATAMAAIGDTRGMIVDVRANPGGWDKVSLEIARWFAGSRALAWSKVHRNGPAHDDFSPWADTYVEASPANGYAGPVVLLTTGATFSAAETFALAMRVRDHVTIMGEPSSGHFSDQYDGPLPNGWTYELSGEIYRAADGQIYEKHGVPVDVPIAFDAAALAQGRDVMLEAAIASFGP